MFYSANAYENGFLNVFSTGNLLNSRTLWQSCVCAKECSLHVNTDIFNTVHCKRHRFLAFFECILLKTYWNEYRINKDGYTGSNIDACWPILTINHVPVQRPMYCTYLMFHWFLKVTGGWGDEEMDSIRYNLKNILEQWQRRSTGLKIILKVGTNCF